MSKPGLSTSEPPPERPANIANLRGGSSFPSPESNFGPLSVPGDISYISPFPISPSGFITIRFPTMAVMRQRAEIRSGQSD